MIYISLRPKLEARQGGRRLERGNHRELEGIRRGVEGIQLEGGRQRGNRFEGGNQQGAHHNRNHPEALAGLSCIHR